MCNKTEDLMKLSQHLHHCSICSSEFVEVLDLLDHLQEVHKK